MTGSVFERAATTVVVATAFALAGCGPPAEVRPELQPARGSLTINGRPAEGAKLVLHPRSGEPFDARGTRPQATVKSDGTFDLMTYQAGDGAPVGEYGVALLWFDNPESDKARDKLSGRYADPKSSGLRVSVRQGVTELPPIALDGVKVQARPAARSSSGRDVDQVD